MYHSFCCLCVIVTWRCFTCVQGVYSLNVDPNQTPKEAISSNSLFPLSPVSELPSPADEAKTLLSTLLGNKATVVASSQSIEKPKEEIKQSSPSNQVIIML